MSEKYEDCVIKRNGKKEPVSFDKILKRIKTLGQEKSKLHVNYTSLCQKIIVTSNPKEIKDSSYIILPGVGSFKGCLNGLRSQPGLFESISENVLVKKKPFLGICVGMQLLFKIGYEYGEHQGLGLFDGVVKKILVKNEQPIQFGDPLIIIE